MRDPVGIESIHRRQYIPGQPFRRVTRCYRQSTPRYRMKRYASPVLTTTLPQISISLPARGGPAARGFQRLQRCRSPAGSSRRIVPVRSRVLGGSGRRVHGYLPPANDIRIEAGSRILNLRKTSASTFFDFRVSSRNGDSASVSRVRTAHERKSHRSRMALPDLNRNQGFLPADSVIPRLAKAGRPVSLKRSGGKK